MTRKIDAKKGLGLQALELVLGLNIRSRYDDMHANTLHDYHNKSTYISYMSTHIYTRRQYFEVKGKIGCTFMY